MNVGNFVDMMRPYFSNYFLASITLPKSFAMMIFLQLVVQEREDMKKNRGMNIVEIMDNVVDNLTKGGESP